MMVLHKTSDHGERSSPFIAKYNDNKFICGTSYNEDEGFETCNYLRAVQSLLLPC